MNIYSFTFSPTGTSAKITQGINDGISQASDIIVNHDNITLRPAVNQAFNPDDIVIVSAPVYGGKIAPIVRQRLQGIKGNGAKCIVVAVYGNRAFENAVNDFSSFMSDKGFRVCGSAAFIGEHSYSTSDYPIAPGRPDHQDIIDANSFGKEIAAKIYHNNLELIDTSLLTDTPSSAESLANFRNFIISYRENGASDAYLHKIDLSLCVDCGICYESCPTKAISDDFHNVDQDKCIKCCACVKSCKQNARSFSSPFRKPLSENFNSRKSPVWLL